METILIRVLLCTYPNGCRECRNIIINNASTVMDVDWTKCGDTREYIITVKNSANSVLYQSSTSCCKGNVTIYYDVDERYLGETTTAYDLTWLETSVAEYTTRITTSVLITGSQIAAEDTASSKTLPISPLAIAVIIVSSVAVIIMVAFVILNRFMKHK